MKRGKKPAVPGPKEFSHAPFKSLKGIAAKPAATGSLPSPPVSEAKTAAAEDDMALFLREVADVQRLHGAKGKTAKGEKPAIPIARKIDEQERRIFLQALEKLEMDVVFEDELPDDVEPLRPMPANRMRQLRRGAIRIDYELDLHGLTRDEALESLSRFISGAFSRGQKCVLVITGKGNNSPGEPVLQTAVAGWLREKGKDMVAEFSPAPRQMGGSGAFVTFLKDKDRVAEGKSKLEKKSVD